MKTLELAELLYNSDSEKIFIEGEDGILYEIEAAEREEQFDGWDTVYPKHLVLKKLENNI